MLRIVIFGAGRMAHSLLSVSQEYPGIEISGVIDSEGNRQAEFEPSSSFPSLDTANEAIDGSIDLVIDFSLAAGTPVAAQWCCDHGVALLSGVTGISQQTSQLLDEAAANAPVLWAPNLSFGVNLLADLIRKTGVALGGAAKVSITETHHIGKKDAPSGTALFLAEQFGDIGEIDLNSIREGDEVGEHIVTIQLADEVIKLSHKALDRRLFARGALDAGLWLVRRMKGRYSAADWIKDATGTGKNGSNGQA